MCACNALGPSQWSETIVAHTSKPPPGAPVHVTAAVRDPALAVAVPGAGSAAEQRAAGSLSDEAQVEPGRYARCHADSIADVLTGAALECAIHEAGVLGCSPVTGRWFPCKLLTSGAWNVLSAAQVHAGRDAGVLS